MAGSSGQGWQHWYAVVSPCIEDFSDSVLGYLPAEHIETPTERLARLNKHRNIDVGHFSLDIRGVY